MMSLSEELTAVTCLGCGLTWLGGHGKEGDPTDDVTYDEEKKTWVCTPCYKEKGMIVSNDSTT